jgi:hypothetical protein
MTTTATRFNPGRLRPGTPTSCPKWCNGKHTNGSAFADQAPVHKSNPRVWRGDPTHDTPTYTVVLYRGDEWFDGELLIGQTDMTVTVSGGYDVTYKDDGPRGEDTLGCGGSGGIFIVPAPRKCKPTLHGNLQAKDARRFARWLSKQADEIDPHRTNGKPADD